MRRQFLGYLSGEEGYDLGVARLCEAGPDLRGEDDDELSKRLAREHGR